MKTTLLFPSVFLTLFLLTLISCSEPVSNTQITPVPAPENVTPKKQVNLENGQKLFLKHCASCHGKNAEGDKNWRKRGMTGMYPPPPLNGSAHTWHHSREVLTDLIKKGTEPMGNMPGWGDKLNDSDISDIVDWVVSIWPKDIYQLWIDRYKMAK